VTGTEMHLGASTEIPVRQTADARRYVNTASTRR
jgi:hypothetical protein